MRHQLAENKLGRHSSWRKATIRDLAKATLIRQRICTTKARAKQARKLVERLITFGKKGTLTHKRLAFAILCDHGTVADLFNRIAPRFKQRNGGYTRIIPLAANRKGDNAEMVYLELTEKDMVIVSKPKTAKVKKDKTVDVTPEKGAAETPAKAETKEKKAKGKAKAETQKPPVQENKPGKGLSGGIRKMFQRKTGGE